MNDDEALNNWVCPVCGHVGCFLADNGTDHPDDTCCSGDDCLEGSTLHEIDPINERRGPWLDAYPDHLRPTHGHAQIQYNDGATESMIGFDPNNEEDIKTLHAMLDEFILQHIVPAIESGVIKSQEHNSFTIFGYVD